MKMTNELSEPAWSGYEQDIPVAQGSVQPAHNGSVAGDECLSIIYEAARAYAELQKGN